MKNIVKPEDLTNEDLRKWLLNVHEKYYIELKKASELPNAFWESYSSFCNTSGGWIILGVEERNPQNEISGVANPQKTLTSLWDQLSNTNKVSYKNIDNQDVNTYIIDGKTVIIIYVKEAAENMKPVFVNGKLENSWIRTGDGDRKVNRDELSALIRNAQPGQDNLPADNFTIEDLDLDSLITFKERVSKRFPKKKYIEMLQSYLEQNVNIEQYIPNDNYNHKTKFDYLSIIISLIAGIFTIMGSIVATYVDRNIKTLEINPMQSIIIILLTVIVCVIIYIKCRKN